MPRHCGVERDMQRREDKPEEACSQRKTDKNNRNARNAPVLCQNAKCRRNVQVEKCNESKPPGNAKKPINGIEPCILVGSQ